MCRICIAERAPGAVAHAIDWVIIAGIFREPLIQSGPRRIRRRSEGIGTAMNPSHERGHELPGRGNLLGCRMVVGRHVCSLGLREEVAKPAPERRRFGLPARFVGQRPADEQLLRCPSKSDVAEQTLIEQSLLKAWIEVDPPIAERSAIPVRQYRPV